MLFSGSFVDIEPSGADFQMRPSAPTLQCLLLECLLSRFPPRLLHIQGICLARFLFQIDVISIFLSQKQGDIRLLLQTVLLDR